MIWDWIVYSLPWQIKMGFWLVLGLGIAGLVLHFFGVRWGLIAAGALAVTAGAATLFNKGQQAGYTARKTQEKGAVDAQQDHWNKIDAKPLDPPTAYDELRRRDTTSGK